MCYYSALFKNPKYTKNKKNGGVIPHLTDIRTEYIPSRCGNCKECRKQKRIEWTIRLYEDIKVHNNGKMVTLTFSNESIQQLLNHEIKKTNKETGAIQRIILNQLRGYERDNQIATVAVKLFRERWRKEYQSTIRHWLVTELGHQGTENIHLHGIVWTNEHIDQIRKIWKYGWIWPRPHYTGRTWVNEQTVNYCVKYVTKVDPLHKEYKSIILSSPGIGENYINTFAAQQNVKNQDDTYTTSSGHTLPLPIYYRNKLFTEYDKENLWIKRLDQQVRYVDGIKYDVSKTQENYLKATQSARRNNTELGYGGRPNENRKEYEEKIREIMINTRLNNIRKNNNKKNKDEET